MNGYRYAHAVEKATQRRSSGWTAGYVTARMSAFAGRKKKIAHTNSVVVHQSDSGASASWELSEPKITQTSTKVTSDTRSKIMKKPTASVPGFRYEKRK
jgi:hypothetical protein